jgi:endoribonuclease Dicer
VSLMIFDECHHARKNHPYNGILREYFQVEPPLRPKVFGMTASPVWNTRNPQVSIAQLESNMNAKVVGIRDNINELEEKSPKPEEASFVNGIKSFLT